MKRHLVRPSRRLRTLLRRAVAALLVSVASAGTSLAAENDFVLWPTTFVRVGLTERVAARGMFQVRLDRDSSRLQNTVVRLWLAAKATPWLTGGVGYDFLPRIEPRYIPEHRFWTEAVAATRWSDLALANGTRFEFRFISGIEPTAVRLRNITRFNHPLAGGWYAVLWNEFFFDLNDAGPIRQGFGENRLFGGSGYRFGNGSRVEAGYMMRYIDRGRRDLIQHTLILTYAFDTKLPGAR